MAQWLISERWSKRKGRRKRKMKRKWSRGSRKRKQRSGG
jgi:hypothetical protein